MDSESKYSPPEIRLPQRMIVQEMDYPKLWTPELLDKFAAKIAELEQERLETPLVSLDLTPEGFGPVQIKDESVNPTGTHKDRLALAVAREFAYIVKSEREKTLTDPEAMARKHSLADHGIERFSIITSGNGGMALAARFKRHDLPPPKLLIDIHTDEKIIQNLKAQSADIYSIDLSTASLNAQDIKTLTNNTFGQDLTSQNLDPDGLWRIYYLDLAREVLRQNPDYIFVPYGSGNLYEGILSTQTLEQTQASVLGAEPEILATKAIMLSAPSKPFKYFDHEEMAALMKDQITGEKTGVSQVAEDEIEQAHALYQKYGINAGYSSAAGLALYIKNFREGMVTAQDKTIIINTGRGVVKQDW